MNLRLHPYQLNCGNRCAQRPFPRSSSTVEAEGIGSIGPLVCVLQWHPEAVDFRYHSPTLHLIWHALHPSTSQAFCWSTVRPSRMGFARPCWWPEPPSGNAVACTPSPREPHRPRYGTEGCDPQSRIDEGGTISDLPLRGVMAVRDGSSRRSSLRSRGGLSCA